MIFGSCQLPNVVSKILLQHFIFHLFLSLASRLLEGRAISPSGFHGSSTRNGDMVFVEDYDR